MYSIINNLFKNSNEKKKSLQEQYDEEQNQLDEDQNKENSQIQSQSSMKNIIRSNKSPYDVEDEAKKAAQSLACSKRKGVITTLGSNNGTINNSIYFDMNVALAVAGELKVGAHVVYLAYELEDHIKVVKIEQVVDENWDSEIPTEEKINKQIEELKQNQPKYFNTHRRNVLGKITERKPNSIVVETDSETMNINLDAVEIDFVPKVGDQVYACCNVQSDENFADKQGNILQVDSVHPSRLQKQEKCVVRRLEVDWGVLNEDCYFTIDILPPSCKLQEGDTVCADLIECEVGEYVWRAIKMTILERAIVAPTPTISSLHSTVNQKHRTVYVSEDARVVFASAFETQMVEMSVTSNCDRILHCSSVEFLGKRRDSQLRVVDPEPGTGFELQPGEVRKIKFEAEAKMYGESKELFVVVFETFRVKRNITVVVCENETQLATERAKLRQQDDLIVPIGGRNGILRSRHYAHQVWSKKNEVVPGVGMCAKRRFIAISIGSFDVPEHLRRHYLTGDRRQDMLDNIEGMFPHLKEQLTFDNYTKRFQTLLHLEEIEYFINFRKYDRERAHFTRENEYLALAVENLAERRPSLVIGDKVHAINPWANNSGEDRTYEGVIHKVLCDRVLLKFNSGFQSKYNGEDYRLEFYFSRFSFRKMHFAVNRIVRHLGDQFLFPSKVTLRDTVQIDVTLNKKDELCLNDSSIIPWYNTSLNPIQKQAICNILRGEAKLMPYVIFGPPGTGKTMTLVETILQLVKNIPSSRLLIGTPSNSSADLITSRLVNSGVLQAGDFVRLVSQNQIEKENIPEELLPYCATIDIAADGTCEDSMKVLESGLKLRCQIKYLGRHRVSISTCTTLGNLLQIGFPPGHFTHVLIDESGQCREPEVMVPITMVSQTRGQVILAGDPHQLQAVVINKYCEERGLSLSFLERVLLRAPYSKDNMRYPSTSGYDPRLVTKLLYNYRALPSILTVYNDLFYDSELMTKIKEKGSREAEMLEKLDCLLPVSDIRKKTHGAFFNGVRSENIQDADSPSWYNPNEARNVFLMTIHCYKQNISPDNIGIITPYMKQMKHLRNMFIAADIAMPKIGTVEEFQGQERDIILISTVRSTQKLIVNDLRHSLGFVQCSKRMNVAISRARYLMMVFGNPHLLYLDQCWRTYIQYCVDNDAYLGCDLPEDFNNFDDANGLEEETG